MKIPTALYRQFRCGMLCETALLILLIFVCGCGRSTPEEQSRAIRLPAQKPPVMSAEAGVGDLYAVVVGVANYGNSKIPQLKFADKDAKDFATFLQTQKELFRNIHLTVLLNEQATQKEVKKRLFYEELRRAGKNDTVILFLAGHGTDDPKRPGEFYFLTYDADPDFLEATAVNMSRNEFMQRIDSKRVLVVADTCHAGGFSKEGARSGTIALDRLMNEFKQSEGRVFLASCKSHEISMEQPALGNGVFTYYLLEGLKGKAARNRDGVVTLQDAYEYVYEKTRNATDGGQHPQFAGVVVGKFPLSLARLHDSVSVTQELSKPQVSPGDDYTELRHFQVNSIECYDLGQAHSYVKLATFKENTVTDLENAIKDLGGDQNLRGLVLDLRANPGGKLDEAVKVVNLFIERGLIVYTDNAKIKDERMEFRANPTSKHYRFKIAVLINAGSAGASEIVAAALQDHDRALILGTKSLGDATITGKRPTTPPTYWYSPKGRHVQGRGIIPDIEIGEQFHEHDATGRGKRKPTEDKAIKKAIDWLKSDITVKQVKLDNPKPWPPATLK